MCLVVGGIGFRLQGFRVLGFGGRGSQSTYKQFREDRCCIQIRLHHARKRRQERDESVWAPLPGGAPGHALVFSLNRCVKTRICRKMQLSRGDDQGRGHVRPEELRGAPAEPRWFVKCLRSGFSNGLLGFRV